MRTVLLFLFGFGAVVAEAQGPVFTTLYEFKGGADGTMGGPTGAPTGVIPGRNGRLYGTTYAGGANSCGSYACGTIYELTPASAPPWTKTVLHNFNGSDGALPDASPIFGSNGILYGTTLAGGNTGGGTVFELAPPIIPGESWTETVLYSFNGTWNEPHEPYGGVVMGPSGALYGATYANWCLNCGSDGEGEETGGTVFLLAPPSSPGGSWTQFTVHSFWPVNEAFGMDPFSGVTFDGGSLYGTTYLFGNDCGAVYGVTPPSTGSGPWTATVVHTFSGGDGCNPGSPLTAGPGGVLYGNTGGGAGCHFSGFGGCGVVFQLTPPTMPGGTWTETVLYSFTGLNGDGALPLRGGLVRNKNGVLYGTTQCGGSGTTNSLCNGQGIPGSGTVFALTPPTTPGGAWSETILHSFDGDDGALPLAGLSLGSNGVLYGTTSEGGSSGNGTVFSIKP